MNVSTIEALVRANVKQLEPYSSARNEFQGKERIHLDANENPFNNGVNRYPDPLQLQLKRRIATLKNIGEDKIFIGNGSDEVLDLILRAFCNPGDDNCISIVPSYGMYNVLAQINDVELRQVQLNDDFDLDVEEIMAQVDGNTKVLFLCSPNNPTGNLLNSGKIEQLLSTLNALIVVDEAYIDFSDANTWLERLDNYPNLMVCQTLSKAWAMAGLRLGLCYAHPSIIRVLNKIKPPYNVNELAQKKALELLVKESEFRRKVKLIRDERNELVSALIKLPMVKKVYPSEANFLLVRFDQARRILQFLKDHQIIIRDRSKEVMCDDCLRITVGSPEENNELLKTLNKYGKDTLY